jgi:glyceraldehyde-3-phosphate dehydrogenase/erythrose-4-phosphate dehydrogenase
MMEANIVEVLSGHGNEWGFSHHMLDTTLARMAAR